MARPIPVLPLVGSTITWPEPGCRRPLSSASLIMYQAGRSLMEPPGFCPSSLTQTSAMPGSTTFSRRTTGVLPITRSTRIPPL
jgi:hypothetical protein